MSSLAVLGVAAAVAVALLVAGSAWLALGDTFRQVRAARRQRAEKASSLPPPPPAVPVRRRARPQSPWQRFTPKRTRLKPYSPEVVAVLLLALAAGLWLARLLP